MRTGVDLFEDLLFELDGMISTDGGEGRGHPSIVESGAQAGILKERTCI